MALQEKLTHNFVAFLRQFVPITEAEVKKILLPAITVREFKKKQLITQEGEVENYINFINQGLIRKYYKHGDEERIVQLSVEGHLISSEESFYTRTASQYFIETIEASSVVSLSFANMEKIFRSSHNFEKLGRLVTVHTMVLKDRWQISLVRDSPRERFINFFNNYPEIIQRVPQKYLASYLNIKPETFSRFKHLIREAKRVPAV